MSKILLAGATGLVGCKVLQNLTRLGNENELHVIARRALASPLPKVQVHIADAGDWPVLISKTAPDVAISCLGTTIKTAGSKAAFAVVDLDLVTAFAKAAKAVGARHMITISSVGANASSSNFYLSTKGKAETALRELGFDRLDIIRPGLLRGNREEQRSGETLGIILSPLTNALLHGPLRRYRSIDSAVVASAIVSLTQASGQGTFIHENDAITALAG